MGPWQGDNFSESWGLDGPLAAKLCQKSSACSHPVKACCSTDGRIAKGSFTSIPWNSQTCSISSRATWRFDRGHGPWGPKPTRQRREAWCLPRVAMVDVQDPGTQQTPPPFAQSVHQEIFASVGMAHLAPKTHKVCFCGSWYLRINPLQPEDQKLLLPTWLDLLGILGSWPWIREHGGGSCRGRKDVCKDFSLLACQFHNSLHLPLLIASARQLIGTFLKLGHMVWLQASGQCTKPASDCAR